MSGKRQRVRRGPDNEPAPPKKVSKSKRRNPYIDLYAEEDGVKTDESDQSTDNEDGKSLADFLDDEPCLVDPSSNEKEYLTHLRLSNKQTTTPPPYIDIDLLVPYFESSEKTTQHKAGQCLLNSLLTALYITSIKKPSKAESLFDILRYYKDDERIQLFFDKCESDERFKNILNCLQSHSDKEQAFVPLNQIVEFVKSVESVLNGDLFVNVFLESGPAEKQVLDAKSLHYTKNRAPKRIKTSVKILHPENPNPNKTPFNSVSIFIKPEKTINSEQILYHSYAVTDLRRLFDIYNISGDKEPTTLCEGCLKIVLESNSDSHKKQCTGGGTYSKFNGEGDLKQMGHRFSSFTDCKGKPKFVTYDLADSQKYELDDGCFITYDVETVNEMKSTDKTLLKMVSYSLHVCSELKDLPSWTVYRSNAASDAINLDKIIQDIPLNLLEYLSQEEYEYLKLIIESDYTIGGCCIT